MKNIIIAAALLASLATIAADRPLMANPDDSGACPENVNFTGTFKVGGIAPTNANTASAIVKRDSSGNFSAGTISAALTGTASGNIPTSSLSTDTGLGTSTTLVPCQNAVKVYADTKPSISSGTLVAMPLTNTKKIGDVYIDTGNANAYICCSTGTDTTGWKQINN